jgi:hypothetical protein
VANGREIAIALAGWTDAQRESLGFLLGDAGIRWRWQGDAVVVASAAEEQARKLVDYLAASGDSTHDTPRADGGLVYPRFEGTERVTIADATPDELFSFCFSDVDAPRAFLGLGEVSSIEHRGNGRFKVGISLETRAGTLERVYEELDRTRPGRLVARASDSWGQVWRETWAFEQRGVDVVVSLTVDVDVADPAQTPDPMRSLRSDWSAQRFAARRLGSIKTQYETGSAPDPQTF